MKRLKLSSYIIVLVAFFLSVEFKTHWAEAAKGGPNKQPELWVVVAQSGGDYTSVSEALADINPSVDTPYLIKVMPGTYAENITMKDYVHLQGAGREVTTIQGVDNSFESAVIALDNLTNVSITGLTITGSYYGLFSNNSWATISGNIFTANWHGIRVNSSSPVISENLVFGNDATGIFTDSASPTISDNIISDNGSAGLSITLFSSPLVHGNIVTGSGGTGIYNYYSSPTIRENTITGNGAAGIFDYLYSSSTITHNKITDNGGATYPDISVTGTSTAKISFNIYDDIIGTSGTGQYNVNSNGDPAPAP